MIHAWRLRLVLTNPEDPRLPGMVRKRSQTRNTDVCVPWWSPQFEVGFENGPFEVSSAPDLGCFILKNQEILVPPK